MEVVGEGDVADVCQPQGDPLDEEAVLGSSRTEFELLTLLLRLEVEGSHKVRVVVPEVEGFPLLGEFCLTSRVEVVLF